MGDNLTILGRNYTNVVGIKATQTNDGQLAYIRPTGTHSITQNGTENVAQYEYVDVDVQFTPNLEDRTVSYTPSTSAQSDTVTQTDPGYDGLGEVTVNIAAMPAGTEGTPTVQVSKSNGVATITPSVTNSAGYIAAAAPIVGTPVQVTGAELASGTLTISQSGETNVAGYEKVSVPLRIPSNSSEDEYYTSSGVRKWRYRPKTVITYPGWVNNGTVNGFWVSFDAIPTGTTVTPSTSSQTIGAADTMLEGAITVEAMPSGSASTPATSITANPSIAIDANGLITAGVSASQSITPSVSAGYIASGTAGTVSVSGTATHQLTKRDSTDLTASGATVSVPAGYYPSSASKTIASGTALPPEEIVATDASVTTGNGVLTLRKNVSVTPDVVSGYIAEGTADTIPILLSTSMSINSSSSLTVSGNTVTAPAGYYASNSSKAVGSGTAGTPIATKGTVSNHSISITPSVTNTTGYITGSTKTGTAVSVSASDLVSGSETKTANGTYDVTNLAELVVNVGGTSKNAQTAQSTTRSTSTSGTNVISLTCSKTGTYDVYWTTFRSSTSGTWGSRLYIGGTAYETMNTSGWSNHVQNRHVSNVSITANQAVAVYVQSRGSNYYGYVGTLTIIES